MTLFTVQQRIPLQDYFDKTSAISLYETKYLGKVYIDEVICYSKQLHWDCPSQRLILDLLRHQLYPNSTEPTFKQ